MIEVSLDGCAPLVRGAVALEKGAGVVPVRLPPWACEQAPDGFTQEVFRMASGVRLALRTEASALEVEVAAAGLGVAGGGDPGLGRPLVADLLVDGRRVDQRTIEGSTRIYDDSGRKQVDATPRVVTAVRFDGLAPARKSVELWLPQNAVVELLALRADAAVEPSDDAGPRWIHYGSSISHCLEADSPTQTWPAISARLGGFDLLNLGFAGNCHLDPFVARTIRDLPADLISFKVGVNIAGKGTFKERSFVPALHGFIETIRDGHPDTPIVAISPVACPAAEGRSARFSPDTSEGALTMPRVREILAEVVEARAPGDPNLSYLDGLSLLGDDDADVIPDGAHPNGDGYLLVGERFAAQAFGDDTAKPLDR